VTATALVSVIALLFSPIVLTYQLASATLTQDPISGQGGLEIQAQNSEGGNRTIDLMVDELLANYPVLSELAQ
jgi:hypothetical protein